MALEWGGHFMPAGSWLTHATANYIQFAFATPVVLWAGWPFFERGWQSLGHPQPQHVHAHRHGHGRGLSLQPGRHLRARHLPARLPWAERQRRGLFRGRQHDHRAGADRPGAGTARARGDLGRHQGAAQSRAHHRAPRQGRRQRRGSRARRRRGRRPIARAPRRQGAARRRGAGRPCGGRRIHGHRRIHAGEQGEGRPRHRRHAQHLRHLS